MTTYEMPDPATLAYYDQALAMSADYLEMLIDTYRRQVGRNCAEGWPEVMTVVACSIWLRQQVPKEAMASALAVSLMELARNG